MRTKAGVLDHIENQSHSIKDEATRNSLMMFAKYLSINRTEKTFYGIYTSIIDLIDFISSHNICIDHITLYEIALIQTYSSGKQNYSAISRNYIRYVYQNGMSRIMKDHHELYGIVDRESSQKGFFDEILKNGDHKFNIVAYPNKKPRNDSYIITKIDDKYISDLLSKFLHTREFIRDKKFIYEMSEFLYQNNIKDLSNEINDQLIKRFFDRYINESVQFLNLGRFFFIWILQDMDNETQKKKFPLYNSTLLKYYLFVEKIKEKYKPVIYNRFDSLPVFDKWLLYPNNDIKISTQISDSTIIPIDFSKIKNRKLRNLIKKFFWYSNSNAITKKHEIGTIIDFCNMYYQNENDDIKKIDSIICAQYKSIIIKKFEKTETRNNRIYPVSKFLKYIDKECKTIDIDPNCFIYLRNKGQLNRNGSKGVDEEDLKKLAIYIDRHKYDSLNSTILYVVFHIALNTEFRISQILTLQTDCIVPGIKKNEYSIHSITKVTAGTIVDQPCAVAVKRIIDSYLKYSANFRSQCNDPELKKYLFLFFDNVGHHDYCISTDTMINRMLKTACDELGIQRYTAKNLRVTYITNAKAYVIKNGLSDLAFVGISGHENVDTVNNHYVQEQIKDALQATNKIIIGDFEVKGKIVTNKNAINTSKDVTVEDGCGYCQNSKDDCDCSGQISCLLCKHFATTVDRIPYYQHKMKQLNNMIEFAKTPHDIQDLKNKTRLFAKYMESLLVLEKEKQYAS